MNIKNTMQYNIQGELILAQCGKNLEMKLVVIQAKFDYCFIQKQKQTSWQLLCAFFISDHSFYFVFYCYLGFLVVGNPMDLDSKFHFNCNVGLKISEGITNRVLYRNYKVVSDIILCSIKTHFIFRDRIGKSNLTVISHFTNLRFD